MGASLSPLPLGEVGHEDRERVYGLSGEFPKPSPAGLQPSTSPLGGGEDERARNPSRVPNMSALEARYASKPGHVHDSVRSPGTMVTSPLPEGEVGPQGRERVYGPSGKGVNPLPPASPSTSPSGRGEGRRASSARSAVSTPSRLSYMSPFVKRTTLKPSLRSAAVRSSSRRSCASVEWVAPSISTISRADMQTKSAMYLSIGHCRLNFQPSKRQARNRNHNRVSASVWDDRNTRDSGLDRSIADFPCGADFASSSSPTP